MTNAVLAAGVLFFLAWISAKMQDELDEVLRVKRLDHVPRRDLHLDFGVEPLYSEED
jgi:hypothetical protein